MSLLGNYTTKNPPNLTNVDVTNYQDLTITDLTIIDHIYFKDVTNKEVGNLVNNISVNQTTNDMTIVTPQESSLIYALGQGGSGSETLFAINPTSLNYNVGTTLETLPYSQLDNVRGSTSNIQSQINAITTSMSSGANYGIFYSTTSQSNTSVGSALNAYMNAGTGVGMSLADYTSSHYNSVQVTNAGVYSVTYTIRAIHTSVTNNEPFRCWLRVNGNDVAYSLNGNSLPATSTTYTGAQTFSNLTWVLNLNAGDKITPYWTSASSNVSLVYSVSSGFPDQPSVVLTITQVASMSQGPQGDQGDQGIAATIDIGSVTTLPATSSAYVTNSGTLSDCVLDFGIPQGPQGVQGETGPQGPQGPPGTTPDLSSYATKTYADGVASAAAASGAAAATAAGAAALFAANAYTDVVALGLQGQITANSGSISTLNTNVTALQTKTQNQTAVVDVTTFAGQVNCDTLDVDNVTLRGSLSGIGKINISSTTGANTIYAPSTTIQSVGGLGGVYLGGYTDSVYINGFPFQWYFNQQF